MNIGYEELAIFAATVRIMVCCSAAFAYHVLPASETVNADRVRPCAVLHLIILIPQYINHIVTKSYQM